MYPVFLPVITVPMAVNAMCKCCIRDFGCGFNPHSQISFLNISGNSFLLQELFILQSAISCNIGNGDKHCKKQSRIYLLAKYKSCFTDVKLNLLYMKGLIVKGFVHNIIHCISLWATTFFFTYLMH
jgi:hypothetical protein